MSPEIISSVAGSIQPLVFETGIEEYPYSIHGTVFLMVFDKRAFVITARHNLTLTGEVATPLCIFPNDTSQRSLPLKDVFFLPSSIAEDDFADFAIMEIDKKQLDSETSDAALIDCTKASGDWFSNRFSNQFFILGYPWDHGYVDYEREALVHGKMALTGSYIESGDNECYHEINIDNTMELTTFSGFSGSPVFAWIDEESGKGSISLCGMVVRGSSSALKMRFIDSNILLGALATRCRKNDIDENIVA